MHQVCRSCRAVLKTLLQLRYVATADQAFTPTPNKILRKCQFLSCQLCKRFLLIGHSLEPLLTNIFAVPGHLTESMLTEHRHTAVLLDESNDGSDIWMTVPSNLRKHSNMLRSGATQGQEIVTLRHICEVTCTVLTLGQLTRFWSRELARATGSRVKRHYFVVTNRAHRRRAHDGCSAHFRHYVNPLFLGK